jgi:pyrroloquinoline quinone biosynthesis protein E
LGDAEAADPVCGKSPHHDDVKKIVLHARTAAAQEKPLIYRNDANSVKYATIPIRDARDTVI